VIAAYSSAQSVLCWTDEARMAREYRTEFPENGNWPTQQDWMAVGAVWSEPVSGPKTPDFREKYRENAEITPCAKCVEAENAVSAAFVGIIRKPYNRELF
jgi:hypothetical protein